jgi:hypothetical protein
VVVVVLCPFLGHPDLAVICAHCTPAALHGLFSKVSTGREIAFNLS